MKKHEQVNFSSGSLVSKSAECSPVSPTKRHVEKKHRENDCLILDQETKEKTSDSENEEFDSPEESSTPSSLENSDIESQKESKKV